MPKQILVADDSLTIRKVIGMVFATEDYQLTSVDNGVDAIHRARELRPDLVLADVMMPGKSGYEVCEALKQDPATQGIPVLLLSGTFEAFDENRARAAQADDHIVKPFESQALLDKVRMLTGGGAPAPRPAQPTYTTAAQAAARPSSPGMPAQAARPPGGAPPQGAPRPSSPGMPIPGGGPPIGGGMRPAPGTNPGMGMRPGGPPAGAQGQAMRPPPGASPGMQMQPGLRPPPGTSPGAPLPGQMRPPPGTSPGMAMRPASPMGAPGQGAPMARPPGQPMPGQVPPGYARPQGPGGPPPGQAARPQQRDPFGVGQGQQQRPAALQQGPGGDGGEAILRDALSRASREVVEKIAWEVVPQLAETIIREELERLIKEREGRS
ncbi:MAG: response regulator [Myxococcaceae bacterium]